jgi:Ni/Fe-hydrogenase 1 B-type cytochrome subunit
MENNNQVTTEKKNPFLQSHSSLIRIWHWITFILISLTIVTVILNSTLLNPGHNAIPVQNQLKEQGVTITDRQAFFVAHHFDDQLWDLHKLIGFGISFMLLFRIIAELFLPKNERIRNRICNALILYREGSLEKIVYRNYLLVKWSYNLFYLLLIFMAVTGLGLAFEHQFELLDKAHRTIKEFHAAGQWVMYTFVLFHIGWVILADLGKVKGIVSGMINGNKNL